MKKIRTVSSDGKISRLKSKMYPQLVIWVLITKRKFHFSFGPIKMDGKVSFSCTRPSVSFSGNTNGISAHKLYRWTKNFQSQHAQNISVLPSSNNFRLNIHNFRFARDNICQKNLELREIIEYCVNK